MSSRKAIIIYGKQSEPIRPRRLDPDQIEDPIMQKKIRDGEDPVEQYFGSASPWSFDK